MSKVALINPGRDPRYAMQEPLNLGFIAAFLQKRGIDVTIIDELAGQDVEKELESHAPDVVGITATTPLAYDAYRIARITKAKGIRTVMGGVHASIFTDEALQHVDIVVAGEGEQAMVDIVTENITSGIVTRPFMKSIDDIPSPARKLLHMDFYVHAKDRNPESYLYFVPPKTRVAAVLSSRGCPFNCVFCHNTWKGMPYRANSPERVIEEIRELVTEYGVQAVFFIEDNFFTIRKRVLKICELLKSERLGIIWGANARVDGIDRETLETARDAGCRQITFGFESGSQRILDVLDKKTTVEQNSRAIALCNEVGLIPQGTIMIGNPTETEEDIRATQRFIRENDIVSLGLCVTSPYPGTKLWDWCKERKLIPDTMDWAQLDYRKVSIPANDAMTPREITRYYEETLRIIEEKRPLTVSGVVQKLVARPSSLLQALKSPGKVLSVARRVLRRKK